MGSKLFGTSGLRGLVNVDLTPVLAVKLGLAIVTFSGARKAVIGRDTRFSGQMIEGALTSGLLAGGADVYRLGVLPTPVLAYLTKKLKAGVGVMVTASHNPPQYNGVKVFDGDGTAYGERAQNEIERILERGSFRLARWSNVGEAKLVDKSGSYVKMVKDSVKLNRKWHVVVDPGCGATYGIAPTLLKGLGCKVTTVNAQPDGFFPGRSPEPNAESLKPLADIVRELGADVGIAYDGDGDRVAFIDDAGNFMDFDRTLAAYASYVVKVSGGGAVVTNVEASMCVEKAIERYGGKVIRVKVGDIYVVEAVKQFNVVFGGEPCGAWVHPQFHNCPDGVISSLLFLKALEDESKTASEFIANVPQHIVLRKGFPCRSWAKGKVMEKVEERLRSAFPSYGGLLTVDGVRLTIDSGWVLVRASGTEDLIRLTVEGGSLSEAESTMKVAETIVEKLIEEVGG